MIAVRVFAHEKRRDKLEKKRKMDSVYVQRVGEKNSSGRSRIHRESERGGGDGDS